MWFNAIQFTKFFSQKPRTGSQKFKKQYFNLSLYSAHKLYVLIIILYKYLQNEI